MLKHKDSYQETTLENLGQGVAGELFQRELEKVLENIQDINTEKTKAREITLKFKLAPNKEGDIADILVESTSKLAPVKAANSTLFFAREDGKFRSFNKENKQSDMFSLGGKVAAISDEKDGE